jgi:2-C-methyl-D-erythritol 4-phosphate cytidylyltransferase
MGVWAVVVAGGSGARFGRPKQFELLAGRPVVSWSVAACRPVADAVVLVLPADALEETFGADVVVSGGATRSASVRRGLSVVPPDTEVVVVHDAARPLATPALFGAVVDAVRTSPGGAVAGAVCALPVADTLKRVSDGTGAPFVVETLDRRPLVAVQTPQAFRGEVLRAAHVGDPEATDDAALVEALGAAVQVVAGDPANVKLTTPADLAYLEHLMGR